MKIKGLYKVGERYYFRWTVNGNRFFKSLGTSDLQEAMDEADRIQANPSLRNSGVWEAEAKAYVDEMLRIKTFKRSTAGARLPVLIKAGQKMQLEMPGDLSTPQLQKWYDTLPESVRSDYLRWIKSFCEYLISEKKLRENPCLGVSMIRSTFHLKTKTLSAKQIEDLLEKCEDRELKLILFLGFDCGLRKEEIVQARPHWINFSAGNLTVQPWLEPVGFWTIKDRDKRTIPLTKRFLTFLATYDPLPSPYLVAPGARAKKQISRYNFRKRFDSYLKTHGLEWVTPKVMRESFGSVRVSAGVPMSKVSKWLGHSSMDTTMDHYIAFDPKDKDIDLF